MSGGSSGLVRSEGVKLWALRPVKATLAGSALLPIGLALSRAAATPAVGLPDEQGLAAALESVSLSALPLAFVAAALGVTSMTAERGECLVSALSAEPRRMRLLTAKGVVSAGSIGGTALLGLFSGWGLSAVVLTARGATVAPAGTVIGVIVTQAACAMLASLIGLAVGTLARGPLASALALLVLLAVLPSAAGFALGAAAGTVTDVLPAGAIQAAVTRPPAMPFPIEGAPPSSLSWWVGLVVLVGWAGVLLAVAGVRFTRRPVARQVARRAPRRITARSRDRSGGGALRAEWYRLRTHPATWWVLAGAVMTTVVIGVGRASTSRPAATDPLRSGPDILAGFEQIQLVTTSSVSLVQLGLALFAAATISREFSTGTIAPAALAVPDRIRLLAAKLAVLAMASCGASVVGFVTVAGIAAPIVAANGFAVGLDDPVVWVTACRSAIAVTLGTVVGAALGAIVRAPVGTVAVVGAVFVVIPLVLGQLRIPSRGTTLVWLANLGQAFPQPVLASRSVAPNAWVPQFLAGDVLQLHPDQAMGVLVAWTIGTVAIAVWTFARRPL